MATVVGILDRDSWVARTDNIVIADPVSRSLTWIPRGLWCPSVGDRINKAFALGGVARLVSGLRELGFQCDHGLVLRRGATERAASRISVEVPVREPLDFWYPLHPTRPIHGPRKPVSFRPPAERLEGDRIHEWLAARMGIARPGLGLEDSDLCRIARQQIFLRALLEQRFDFAAAVADRTLVRMSSEDALKELACVEPGWRMQTFADVRVETIGRKMMLVKRDELAPPSNARSPQLAVVILARGASLETVEAVRSLLDQKPRVEVVVVNIGTGIAQLLAQNGLDVPVIEHGSNVTAGAARNIGIRATRAPYVAFLAAGCTAPVRWARQLVKAHHHGAAIAGCTVENSKPRNPFAWAGYLATWRCAPSESRAAFTSYDRRIFERHGFFREDVGAGEQAEIDDHLPPAEHPIQDRKIVTLYRAPTGLLRMMSRQFRRGVAAARSGHGEDGKSKPAAYGFASWRGSTIRALRASREIDRKYRVYVWLARPLIPIAVAAYHAGVHYQERKSKSARARSSI